MRDYLIIAIVLASLPVGLFSPYGGLLVYSWISYMYPQWLAWSFARTFPVAYLAGLSLIVGFIIHRFPGQLAVVRMRENTTQIALLAMFTVSSIYSLYPVRAWVQFTDMLKIIVVALLTSILLTNRARVRMFLMVVALSLGFYGFKGGIFGIKSSGENLVWGPGTSIIGANNAIGLALNMCLPMLWYLSLDVRRTWLKLGLRLTFFLTIPAIMFTYSRASTLGLVAVLLVMILKSRKRFLLLALALVIGFIALPSLPDKWMHRQRSTYEYQEDVSALSRLEEWKFCWRVALDRPFIGAGFDPYTNATYMKYYPEFLVEFGRRYSAHSIYFGILAEHGFIGLALYLAMIAFCFLSTRKIKRQVRGQPEL